MNRRCRGVKVRELKAQGLEGQALTGAMKGIEKP